MFAIATSAALVHYGRIRDESVCILDPRLHLASRTYGATSISLASVTLITTVLGMLALSGNAFAKKFGASKFFKVLNMIMLGLKIAVFALFLWLTILTFRGSKWALAHGDASAETMIDAFTTASEYAQDDSTVAAVLGAFTATVPGGNIAGAIAGAPEAAAEFVEAAFDGLCTDYTPMAIVNIVIWVVGGFLMLLGLAMGPIVATCALKALKNAATASAAAPSDETAKANETKPAAESSEPAKETA